jgi:hypothetical protein
MEHVSIRPEVLAKLYCITVGIVIYVHPHNFDENQQSKIAMIFDHSTQILAPQQRLTELAPEE